MKTAAEQYTAAIMALRSLPDRGLDGPAFANEWSQLNRERDSAARQLTPEEVAAAYQRAKATW